MLSVLFSNVTLTLLPHHSSPTSTSSLLGRPLWNLLSPCPGRSPLAGAPPALQGLLLSSLGPASPQGPQLRAVPAAGAEPRARPYASCLLGGSPSGVLESRQAVPPRPPLPGPVKLGGPGVGCTASPGWDVGAPGWSGFTLCPACLLAGTSPVSPLPAAVGATGTGACVGSPRSRGPGGGWLRGEPGAGLGWGAWSEVLWGLF